MKKTLILLFVLLVLPIFTYALGTRTPFGGRITRVHSPENVVCDPDPTYSPFWIKPVCSASPGPWSTSKGKVNVGMIGPRAWVLGMYVPVVECTEYNGESANPYPTTRTNFYGTSLKKVVPI